MLVAAAIGCAAYMAAWRGVALWGARSRRRSVPWEDPAGDDAAHIQVTSVEPSSP
jgi:hypothetical protein